VGQCAQGCLRRPVGADAGRDLCGNRCDVDDAAGLLLEHHRNQRLAAQEGAAQVHLEYAIPERGRKFLEGNRRRADGCIVHQHITATEA
jgi:hypothetical protein